MSGSIADDELRVFVERIQRLTEERQNIARDIADVLAEAKSRGFDKAAIKWVVSELSKDFSARQKRDAIREMYMAAATGSRVHVHEEA